MILAPGTSINTLYLGGGTPSLLDISEIEMLITCVRDTFTLEAGAEITLEANPDDIAEEKLQGWKRVGINRLSIGVQSFYDKDLQWMNRAHNASQAIESILLSRKAGFTNFSVDLIFGLPNLTDEEWLRNIRQVIELKIPHIACYALTVEPRTALFKMIELNKKENIDNDVQARQFEILMHEMSKAGYQHYEISNFALPGFRSQHNSSYWQQKPYLGIGPSAHSFDGKKRYWNVSNNHIYQIAIDTMVPFFEMEVLTRKQHLNEYLMTSLRTSEGLDLAYVSRSFSPEEADEIRMQIDKFPKEWIDDHENIRILTSAGKLFADKIAAEIFS